MDNIIRNRCELFDYLGIESIYSNDNPTKEYPYDSIKKRVDDILSDDPERSFINWDRTFYALDFLKKSQPFGKVIDNINRDLFICPYASKDDLKKSAKSLLNDAIRYAFEVKDKGEFVRVSTNDGQGKYDNYTVGRVSSGHIVAEVYLYYSGDILVDSCVELLITLDDDREY